jgi:hypothetical protein
MLNKFVVVKMEDVVMWCLMQCATQASLTVNSRNVYSINEHNIYV